jgi:hypothetical protein
MPPALGITALGVTGGEPFLLQSVLAEYADHYNIHRPHRPWDRCRHSA